jgi:hypothetical protein
MGSFNESFREIQFDPPDLVQVRLLKNLPGAQRVRTMLEARELAVGLIRGRLRQCYPDLSINALNLKVLDEIEHASKRTS